ncbi:hypothetical protein BC826DRAFT_1143881 [Russula brevipes]|nr:hypothetical protein BC826DRAFT_1143881 [Russula brevipes]
MAIDFDHANETVPLAWGSQGPPPSFTPYVAEHKVSGDETISHDPHLNEDGEALYRFLLSQAETPPTFLVHCLGTHTEKRHRMVSNGNGGTRRETYTETVTDFSFSIGQRVLPQATQWTVGDNEPVFRGHMVRETGLPGSANKAESAAVKKFKEWSEERTARGLPPWVGPRDAASREPRYDNAGAAVLGPRETDVLKSSWTLRQWADDYCNSRATLKEFVYEKVVHGWDLSVLDRNIQGAIRSTNYRGDVTINFKVRDNKVVVRPDGRLSRTLSNSCLKFLLIITLVYPFIWLFRRFSARGGGRWTVAGGAYALKCWVVPPNDARPGAGPDVFQTPAGPRVLVGMQEGEWFRSWEHTIKRSASKRKVDSTPMY